MNGGGKGVSENGGRISMSSERMEVLSRAQSQPDVSRNSSALLQFIYRFDYFRTSSIYVTNTYYDAMCLCRSKRNNKEE